MRQSQNGHPGRYAVAIRPPRAPQPHSVAWDAGDVGRGLLLFAGVYVGVQILAVIAGAPFGLESSQFYAAVFVASAIGEIGYAAIALRYAGRSREGAWRALGIHPPALATVGWAVAGLTAALAVSYAYGAIVELFDLGFLRTACAEQIPAAVREKPWLLGLAAFVVIVFAPPCEEAFFRGFVYQGLAGRWGIAAGIVASALIFAAPHLTYRSLVPIAGAGAVFALTFWRSGNLLSTVVAHTAFNAISIAVIASGACD